jgi:hypothetical protein
MKMISFSTVLLILGYDGMLRVGVGDKNERPNVGGALTVDSSSQVALDTDDVLVRSKLKDLVL